MVQKCAVTLALPSTVVFNQITKVAQFPRKWEIEYQLTLPIVFPPESEDELRNFAWWYITFIDQGQCGVKGFQ
jgi:hypothetical protein